MYPNRRKEYFANSSHEKCGVTILLCTKLNMLCLDFFMKIYDCITVSIVLNSIAMVDNKDINMFLSLPGRHAGEVEV